MNRALQAVLALAGILYSHEAAALYCPEGNECFPILYTPWCHQLGGHQCAMEGIENQCPEQTHPQFIGARTYRAQAEVSLESFGASPG